MPGHGLGTAWHGGRERWGLGGGVTYSTGTVGAGGGSGGGGGGGTGAAGSGVRLCGGGSWPSFSCSDSTAMGYSWGWGGGAGAPRSLSPEHPSGTAAGSCPRQEGVKPPTFLLQPCQPLLSLLQPLSQLQLLIFCRGQSSSGQIQLLRLRPPPQLLLQLLHLREREDGGSWVQPRSWGPPVPSLPGTGMLHSPATWPLARNFKLFIVGAILGWVTAARWAGGVLAQHRGAPTAS